MSKRHPIRRILSCRGSSGHLMDVLECGHELIGGYPAKLTADDINLRIREYRASGSKASGWTRYCVQCPIDSNGDAAPVDPGTEIFLVMPRRKDGQTPKIEKALDRLYFDRKVAEAVAEGFSDFHPWDVHRFIIKAAPELT